MEQWGLYGKWAYTLKSTQKEGALVCSVRCGRKVVAGVGLAEQHAKYRNHSHT